MKVPDGWRWSFLSDVANINQLSLPENCDPEKKFFYLDLGSIEKGKILLPSDKVSFRDSPSRARRLFDQGDVLMATVRPQLGGHAYISFSGEGYVCSTGFAVLRPKAGTNGKFLFQTLFSPWFARQYLWLTAGSSYPAVNASQVSELEILLPTTSEQNKIAAILDCWDGAVVKTEALLNLLLGRKSWLLLKMLTGDERFPRFRKKPWRSIPIGSLLEETDRYVNWSDDAAYKFASIRRRSGGIFNRGTYYGRDVKTKVLKLLRANDFVVSKRQVVHGAWAMVTKPFDGFGVSDEYDVLVNREPEVLDIRFFNYLSQTRRLWHMAYLASNGVHIEKLIFDFKQFAKEKINIPATLAEQQKIVSVLSACDCEIDLVRKQVDALKQQKRGLMQSLLTGQTRVRTTSIRR